MEVTQVLLRERANVEAALAWGLESGRGDVAAEIVGTLGEAWHQLGPRAFALIERTAAACPDDSPFRGWMTYWDYRRRWDTELDDRLLLDLLHDSETGLRSAGDTEPLAALLAFGGNLGTDLGLGPDWGVDRAREAVGLAQQIGDDWLLSLTAASLTRELREAGRTDEVRAPLDLARSAASRLGDLTRLDALTITEAELVALQGRHDEAWAIAAPAAIGLVSSRSDALLWNATYQLARLAAHAHPAAAAVPDGRRARCAGTDGQPPQPPGPRALPRQGPGRPRRAGRRRVRPARRRGARLVRRRRRRLGARPAGRRRPLKRRTPID